ncbi:MAG: DinB family protein [Pirellula sp.]
MTEIQTYIQSWQFNRTRTLATLAEFDKRTDPSASVGWRPGPGRAHSAWQFMHIAITEELFATARLLGTEPSFGEWIERFRGGSTPDEVIPTLETIRSTLDTSRQHLIETVSALSIQDLDRVPEALAQRGWTIRTALQVIAWHESHHQGQIHLTLNLLKSQSTD